MKIETKKIDATKIQLDIEVPEDVVKKKFEEVYVQIGKEAKIPGFRPGKAPRDVLQKHHGRLAQEEVIKNLVPEAYKDSVDSQKLSVVELPEISDVKLQANVLSFKAVVEIRPEIAVKDYKNIKVRHKRISVSKEDIDKTVGQLKELHKAPEVNEKFARSLGYSSVLDLNGSIERQLFIQKENDQRYRLQDELVRQVLGKVDFKVPESLVGRRLEELVKQAMLQMARRGMDKEQIESKEEQLRKELGADAKEQVKTFLVLEEIAKKENIAQDEGVSQKVIEFLLSEADWEVMD